MSQTSSITIPRRRDDTAHARAVGSQFVDVVISLVEILGRPLTAVLVGKDSKTIARWAAQPTRITPDDEKTLRDALQVAETIMAIDAASVARAWFMGMNPQLNDDSPVEALADGRAREVLAAARAYVNAG